MADRYWVGGTGTWDATSTTNWATSSGGAAGASAPTSADNVIFDANSNTGTNAFTVTVGGTNSSRSACNDFTTGGAGGALDGAMTLAFGGTANVGYLDCYGSMTLPATNFSVTGSILPFGPQIEFKATTTGKTITTNGVSLSNLNAMIILGVGGGWTLGSALTVNVIYIHAGTFNTGNYNVTTDSFRRDTDFWGSATLTLGSSTISLTSGTFFDVPTNLTLNANTSQINISGGTSQINGGFTYYNVSFGTGAGTRSINGSNTFNNLTFTSRAANGFARVALAANQTISGALTLGAANTGVRRIKVESDTIGTQRTITCNGTLAALSDIDFRDINAAGTVATPWTGTRIGNALGNSNITFTAASDKYWNLAAGGNWSATAWATSSGGAVSTNNFPLAQDKVIIENTGLNTSATITFNAAWNIGELDISTRTNAMTLLTNDNVNLQIYKNITLSSAVTTTVGATGNGVWTAIGQGTTQILDVNTATITPNITVESPNGTLQLSENTTCSKQFEVEAGTLNLNDKTLTCDSFKLNETRTRAITFGTGNITVTGNDKTVLDCADTTNFTYTGTPTFNSTYSGSTGTRTFNFGSAVSPLSSNAININITAGTDTVTLTTNDYYKNINFTGFAGTLTNNTRTIFGNLTIASGMTLTAGSLVTTFAATSGTQTITSNGKTLDFPVTMNGVGGTVEMADALTIGSTKILTLNAGTIKFKNGTTNSAGTFVIEGSSGNQVVLNSTSSGNQYTLSQSSGIVIAKFATIKDSIGTGGAAYVANLDTNINSGNTTNWLFTSNNLIFLS